MSRRQLYFAMAASLLFVATPSPAMAQTGATGEPVRIAADATGGEISLLEQPARLSIRDVGLTEALSRLHDRSGVALAFSPSLLPASRLVTCECGTLSVGAALERILTGTGFGYTLLGSQIVIEREEPRPAERTWDRGWDIRWAAAPPASMASMPTPSASAATPERAGGFRAFVASLFTDADGSIAGVVTMRETGEPVAGAQVYVEGTTLGALTEQNGRYAITGVPAGRHTLVVQHIGYAQGRQDNVRVSADEVTVVDFALRTTALRLEEVVVTGMVDPVAGVKAPFVVGKLSKDQMPNPATNSALTAIQGKIPGVSIVRPSGQPGSDVFIQLRSPTSMVRNNTPMFVVDGVVLGSDVGSTMVDIESLDIESIEVVKGAAGAALYGSRAASGVIQITTSRGKELQRGVTRVSARSEFGFSELPKGVPLAQSHFYATDEAGNFIDASGNVALTPQDRVIAADRLMDKAYGVPLYDNLRAFYRPGRFMTNSVSIGHNTASSNFRLSVNNYREKGAIVTNDGYERTNFRLNLDHRLTDKLGLSTTVFHNRSHRDDLSGSPFWDILMYTPDVDLGKKDADGNYLQQPDPLVFSENPIWRQTSRDNYNDRVRTLLSGRVDFNPFNWLTFDGSMSYDRSDRTYTVYVPKGTPIVNSNDEDAAANGRLDKSEYFNDALNASAGATIRWALGDLNTRTTMRYIMEDEKLTHFRSDARDFYVRDVPNLSAARRQLTSGHFTDVRSDNYLANVGLDYADKYVGDLLVRRDGSSLFGPDARWANYYRVSGAYRLSREDWWPIERLTEFKLRASQGTAGGRPRFSDQYETWTVRSDGSVSKGTLGNRFLRPEHTTEREFGMDMVLDDRWQFELTYATQRTTDQIIQIPQAAVTGYSNQWQNSGTIEGNTWEATLQGMLVSRPGLSWTSTVIADRTRSEFTEWNRVCYIPSSGYAYRCQGMNHTQFYGERFLKSTGELPETHAGSQGAFAINDDGYLVAVGEGGSWQEARWGDMVEIDGVRYKWGMPILARDEAGNPELGVIGEGFPDFSVGWMNQLRWRGIDIFSHLHAQVGGQVYNHTKQRLYQHFRHADLDQSAKPQERKKPIDYYQVLYEANNINSHFVEPGGFLKLREVSLRYTLDGSTLERFGMSRLGTNQVRLGLIGRNLWTMTDYSGFDPEVGRSNGFVRADNFAWPHTRTLTANVEIVF